MALPAVARLPVCPRHHANHVDPLTFHDQDPTLFWYMISHAESKLASMVALGRGAWSTGLRSDWQAFISGEANPVAEAFEAEMQLQIWLSEGMTGNLPK